MNWFRLSNGDYLNLDLYSYVRFNTDSTAIAWEAGPADTADKRLLSAAEGARLRTVLDGENYPNQA